MRPKERIFEAVRTAGAWAWTWAHMARSGDPGARLCMEGEEQESGRRGWLEL